MYERTEGVRKGLGGCIGEGNECMREEEERGKTVREGFGGRECI